MINNGKIKEKENNKNDVRAIINRSNGITLISLVITIVVLIILAAVAINLSLGENGIFRYSKESKTRNTNSTS